MTEYELLDLLTATSLAAMDTLGYYLTILASYLVASYFVGKQLTTTQAVTVSVLFVFGALGTVYTSFNYMARAVELADSLEMMFESRTYGAQPLARNFMIVLQLMGVLACLKFMWDVRHPKPE